MSPNPYVIGTPILNRNQLFGREKLLRTIEDSLQQNAKFILLHGQRRIGKSSVLKNIPLFISQDQFVFVPCDLQHHSYSSLGEILYAIANAIVEHLNIDSSTLDSLEPRYLDENPKVFTWRLLAKVLDSLGNKKLVLLLDEFDVVSQNNTKTASDFLRFLDNLVRPDEELFVIAVVGRYIDSIPTLVQYFRDGIYQKIDLLDYESAKQQITQPADGSLLYQQKSLEEILKFSAGHPYYTQILCHVIFNKARNENYSTILPDFVNDAVNNAIECAEGGLASIWDGLSIPEKVVISAVAEAQKSNTIENPLKLLEIYGLVRTNSLEEAIQLLINKGFLDSNQVKIKVELVRLWLLQRHPLRDEIKILETLEEENVKQLLLVARNCWIADKQQDALDIYEKAIKLNPNHFSIIVELAEKYLQVKNFDKSLKLYERLYKLDRKSYQENFIQALNLYGHWLTTEKKYTAAKQQYEKILQIQPGNSLAQQRIAEIKAYQYGKTSNNINFVKIKQALNSPILVIILVSIGGLGIVAFANLIFQVCPVGQGKSLGIFCTNSIKISRGDRTLFPDIQNSDRDSGIDSFNNGDYPAAENHFKKAFRFNNNRPDPEALIYQNNALARQKGKPLTLAVVVPATNRTDLALEMLRGIAQAQNQFNQRGGLKGRLLEIVIADDENKVETAKLVAEELVKDKSLLGIIGHNSSHVTKAALNTYEKAELPVISPTSTSTELQQSRFFFRTVPSDEAIGKKLTEHALELKIKKVLIFCNLEDPYSNSLREEFRTKFEQKNGEIPERRCINIIASDFNEYTIKSKLSQHQPQGLLLFPDTPNLQKAITIIKSYKEWLEDIEPQQRPKIQLLGGSSLYSKKILEEAGDGVEGLVVAVPWFRNAVKSINFTQKAEKKWLIEIGWYTASSFDATQVFIKSFQLSLNQSQNSNLSKATVWANLPNVKLSADNTSGEELIFEKNTREMKREQKLIRVNDDMKFIVIPEPNLGKLNNSNEN